MSNSALHKVLFLSIVGLGWMPAGTRGRRRARARGDGDGRERTEVDPLLGRRHRLHVRAGVQAGLAWPKITVRSFVRTVNYETGSMRDEIVFSARRSAGRRRLSACGAATQRAVCERRLRLEPVAQRAGARAALRRRPRPPAVDHAAGRHQGGDQEQCDGPAGDTRRQILCRRVVHRARPVQGDRVFIDATAASSASNRASPIRCWARRRWSPPTPTTATSAA